MKLRKFWSGGGAGGAPLEPPLIPKSGGFYVFSVGNFLLLPRAFSIFMSCPFHFSKKIGILYCAQICMSTIGIKMIKAVNQLLQDVTSPTSQVCKSIIVLLKPVECIAN